jgi:hypothetical protein
MLAVLVVVVALVGSASVPVAAEDAAEPGARSGTLRYFGRAPWQAIEDAAAAVDRDCQISDDGLVALAVSPVFKESSTATSPSTAPAPMTLSRYDEWNGTLATTSNGAANHGLYAFRDPSTPYKRAYWHAGIGIWQYDSAGVGAPYTAIERMDVRVVAADVMAGMAERYCDPDPWLPESADANGFDGQERRHAAWFPWGYPCTLCQAEFAAMTTGDFANISLVDGISVTGGAEARTCAVAGVAGTVPCWYIDARVGVIEGATSWARADPSGGSPTVAPAPLAEAFYVLERSGREERHFLAVDTGYPIDISGSRQLGKNARPRSNQAGSGVTWVSGSGLCDLTAQRGACAPPPPSGISSSPLSVNGTYRPVSLDADGDGRGDVLWYAPGSGRELLWLGEGSGRFTSVAVAAVTTTYDDVVVLDVDGNGRDDVLWYSRRTGAAQLWAAAGDGQFLPLNLLAAPGKRPVALDRDGDGADELFWYGPGTGTDAWAVWNGAGFTLTPVTVSGSYQPFAADFDGNGREDLFWYAPGSGADRVWLHRVDGGTTGVSVTVDGSFVPLLADVDGDGAVDVFWYAAGTAPDSLWFGGPSFTRRSQTVTANYAPIVADLGGDGRDDLLWYAPGSGRDPWWRWSADRVLTGSEIEADGSHQAVVGGFSARGLDGVLWYAPGATPDALWWR